MKLQNEIELESDINTVWSALNDPVMLRDCIPGCQSLEATEEGGFNAIARIKVGPIAANFSGSVMLSELDPPNGYRISGSGNGGVAGMAKGGAVVRLHETASGTLLSYEVDAQVSGKIAQLGSRLVEGVAKRTAAEFFSNFAERLPSYSPAR